jgi:serine/threonine-protein kinase HipA
LAVDPVRLPLPPKGEKPRVISAPEGHTIFSGILDALPDTWGRTMIRKAFPDHVFDDFEFVRVNSAESIGALAFGSTTAGPGSELLSQGLTRTERSLEVLQRIAIEAPDLDRLTPEQREVIPQMTSAGGARPKATFVDHEGRHWLAKFDAPRDEHDWQRIEHATMSLARACGFRVPETRCLEVVGRRVFLIERFDRLAGTDVRLPFASALTMTGLGEIAARYGSYADIAQAIRRFVRSDKVKDDLRELFRRAALNALVHNNDDHMRNHGFLHDGTAWRLSPLYDVVPKPTIAHDRYLAIAIHRSNEASLSNILSASAQFGLSSEEGESVLEELRGQVASSWETIFREAGCGTTQIEAFRSCFRTAMNAEWKATDNDMLSGFSRW